jgi:hypothetical protein
VKARRLGKRQQIAASLAFVDAVNAELERAGAVKDPVFGSDTRVVEDGALAGLVFSVRYVLETKAGTMRCGALPSTFGAGGQLYAQFLDVDRACKFFGVEPGTFSTHELNGCSGKWNLLLFDVEPRFVEAEVRKRLAQVLIPLEVP